MKHYYICANIGETVPSYDFVLQAENESDAYNNAFEIITRDYPEECEALSWDVEYSDTGIYNKFTCEEVTAEELLKKMLLN